MITHSKQDWSIGATVKVGFLQLKVVGFAPTIDYKPSRYLLENAKGVQYTFTPHYGLERV